MRGATLLTVALLAGCQARNREPDALDIGGTAAAVTPRDSADRAVLTPRVVTGPTVLVFWLAAADTLAAPDQAAALDDLTYYTDRIAPTLARHDIKLVPTNAETVYVALPNHQRRAILLSGLDYPFGYVLVQPGGDERVLAGVYADDELLDEVRVYFDLPTDTTATRPRITT
ncbi:MAG TPA: hypothetical protein VN908_02785 [Gemmatimonadales bacterium]|nr:hypothetical protein [Gemmatimonadales bacterium]